MHESDGIFPDDVPIADAAEQERPTAEFLSSSADDDYAEPPLQGEVPLEANPADWQEQEESVLIDPELEEPAQPGADDE
ncbi:hypothetical protein [Mycobacterium sp. 1423905.2]|uniref:hypothetical protein n=1 Tax=Mycobacterium sp. 1423905.2 TaxID=1856859 RepID=UPI0008018B29|nr:hypothetical protein [Mycobacterium sp. 1423905.2]OBJ49262.1 hypothetical protein A9W95_02430 [Mycobacterium sp. 1423905.2]